jgi:hypothetical protein
MYPFPQSIARRESCLCRRRSSVVGNVVVNRGGIPICKYNRCDPQLHPVSSSERARNCFPSRESGCACHGHTFSVLRGNDAREGIWCVAWRSRGGNVMDVPSINPTHYLPEANARDCRDSRCLLSRLIVRPTFARSVTSTKGKSINAASEIWVILNSCVEISGDRLVLPPAGLFSTRRGHQSPIGSNALSSFQSRKEQAFTKHPG